MSDRKTIQVNMDLFNLPSKKTKKKKDPGEKKDIKIKNGHNKTMKNKLLRYIRDQQEKNYEKLFDNDKRTEEPSLPVPDVLANANSDFEKSVAYMKTLEEEKKKNVHNSTIKHKMPVEELAFHNAPMISSLNSYPNIVGHIQPGREPTMELKPRPTMNVPSPTYGCLKNGNLPTYRSMMQQTVKNHSPNIQIVNPGPTPMPMVAHTPVQTPMPMAQMPQQQQQQPAVPMSIPHHKKEHNINIQVPTHLPQEERLEQLKTISKLNQLRTKMTEAKLGGAPKNMKYLKRKKTLRRTYNLGKSKVHPKVSVLVTNRTIRKKISTQAQQLKQIPIEDIRKYLTQKGLIKVGSIAPNDVLRQMYENAVLIGADIYNHNPENLLYNYMNG